jgi:hypothetical protein
LLSGVFHFVIIQQMLRFEKFKRYLSLSDIVFHVFPNLFLFFSRTSDSYDNA